MSTQHGDGHGAATVRKVCLTFGLLLLVLAGSGANASESVAVPKFVHREVVPPPTGTGAGQQVNPVDAAVNLASVADGSSDPLGQPVDGYVYVADAVNQRVQVFSSDGEFQFMFGGGVRDGAAVGQVCDRDDATCVVGVAGVVGGAFNRPQGVAINQASGHVFVRDSSNRRVQEFEADGDFVRAWGFDVALPAATPADTAVFETCVSATDCKTGVTGAALGQFATAFFPNAGSLDVHQPTGDVLVGDPGNGRIQRFAVPDLAGDPVVPAEVFGTPAIFTRAPDALFGNPTPGHVAVDDDGIVYADTGAGGNQIVRYDLDTGAFVDPVDIASLTGTAGGAGTVGLEVDASSGNLFVARDQLPQGGPRFSPVFELSSPGATAIGDIALVDTHVAGTGIGWVGIGLDSDSGELYMTGPEGRLLGAADGPTPEPGATFEPYFDIEARSATVSFSVDTTGELPVDYELQLANSATGSFATVASGRVAGSAAPVPVSRAVSGLRPSTAYRVRVVTTKTYNNPSATDESATLLVTDAEAPAVVDVRADSITDTAARLAGRVNPNGLGTSYHFQWGEGALDHSVPVPAGPLGDGHVFEFVAERLVGLKPSTTYQFRLVATSEDSGLGSTASAIQTFTTAAQPGAAGRGYELVSPADKYGGQGVGFWPQASGQQGIGHLTSSGVGAHVGDRFVVMSQFGSTVSGDGAFSHANDFVFAERTGDEQGWRGEPAITHPSYAPKVGQALEIVGASEDLSSLFWGSPSTPALFPELAGAADLANDRPGWGNFDAGLLSDWGGPSGGATRWEMFGPRGLGADHVVPKSALPASGLPVWTVAFAADGSTAYGVTNIALTARPVVHGLAGADDPTGLADAPTTFDPLKELVSGRSIYEADLSAGLADTFAGTGPRPLVNVCTGEAGVDRTAVPTVVGTEMEAVDCPAGVDGRPALISTRGAAFTTPFRARDGAVSLDGSRVFFLSPDPQASGGRNGTSQFCTGSGDATLCPPQLYVRQRNADGSVVTRWLSKAAPGLLGEQAASLTGTARFEGASADGSRVFFRTNSPLTVDDPNGLGAPTPGGVKTGSPNAQSWDLYMLELSDGPDPTGAGSSLTRISAGPDGSGDCNSPRLSAPTGDDDVVGALRFLSEDGSRAYFTCQAPLPGVAAPPDPARITAPSGTPTTTDATNLYVHDLNQGPATRWRFIARLPRATGNAHATCASTGVERRSPMRGETAVTPTIASNAAGSNCLRGTQDGAFITLFTPGRLTADAPGGAPVDDPPGVPVSDIYGYDAVRDELVRITAPQGGDGESYKCIGDNPFTTADESAPYACRGDGGVDAQIGLALRSPGPINLGMAADPTQGERVVFFQSGSRLTADDHDDGYDVYEWRDGSLSLLTSGAATSQDALYKGNDRSGRNVYFVTRDALTWQDSDVVADIYAARTGGGVPQPPPPDVCQALLGGCQSGGQALTVPPQRTGTAGSGNVAPLEPLAVERPGRKALKKAARSGVLRLVVRANKAGVVRGAARARLNGRLRAAGSGRVNARQAGRVVLPLKLSRQTRKALGAGRRMVLSVRISGPDSKPRTMRLTLRRAGR